MPPPSLASPQLVVGLCLHLLSLLRSSWWAYASTLSRFTLRLVAMLIQVLRKSRLLISDYTPLHSWLGLWVVRDPLVIVAYVLVRDDYDRSLFELHTTFDHPRGSSRPLKRMCFLRLTVSGAMVH